MNNIVGYNDNFSKTNGIKFMNLVPSVYIFNYFNLIF